jgi:hypothetical protein
MSNHDNEQKVDLSIPQYQTKRPELREFNSADTEINQVIARLLSNNWNFQNEAIDMLKAIPVQLIDSQTQFLLGRSILHATTTGAFRAENFFKLDFHNNIEKYLQMNLNHVLNGILFEIYYNSEGEFRKKDFKNLYIDEIFELDVYENYKQSFNFIHNELVKITDCLIYLPDFPPKTFDLVIGLISEEGEKKFLLSTARYQEKELILSLDKVHPSDVTYVELKKIISKIFCVPQNRLNLLFQVELDDDYQFTIPTPLGLTKIK